MIMLTNSKVITDDEKKHEGMLPLTKDDEVSEEELYTNYHVGLVARRALTTQVKEDELQCENISTRHVQNKVCSLVIAQVVVLMWLVH